MPKTIDQLDDEQQMKLFRAMVQTGAIVASLTLPKSPDPVEHPIIKATDAVAEAAKVTIGDLRAAGVSPDLAALELINHLFRGMEQPDWL